MKKLIVDGNEACSLSSYMFTEVAGIYPITPSSQMAENIDKWSSNGKLNLFEDKVKVVEMQSEAGAAGMVHGSLKAGSLTSTYTASQGLLLMVPNMYKISGELLPGVFHVSARTLSTHALSILGDHQDIYATRMTGFSMLASSSVEEVNHMTAIAHLSAIKASLPFLQFFDGFRTSHELQKINVLEEKDVKDLIDYAALDNFRKNSMHPLNPKTHGTAQSDDVYFQNMEVRNQYYDKVPDIVEEYMNEINKVAGTDYKLFNYYGSPNATKVVIAMGSVCETIKETIDAMKEDVGLIEVHLYRPFSLKHFKESLPNTVKKIAVLDRTKEPGSLGEPLYLDVCAVLKDSGIEVVGGRYGLSSKDTNPSCIKAVFDMLDNPKHNFTVGINDDVTNLSLPLEDFKIKCCDEMLIYGYGSDGMVSASKSIIKIIGEATDKYVQGYFQYDSKKSGGVTKTHLRFSDDKIRSTYYVKNPSLIAVTKDSYMDNYKILEDIEENGTFILNTTKTPEETTAYLSDNVKKIIVDRNVNFYTINAFELARKVGLGNKISTIMEAVIYQLSEIIRYEKAIQTLKEETEKRFGTAKAEVVKPNLEAIELAKDYLKEVKIEGNFEEIKKPVGSIYEMMSHRRGDELPVSAFLTMPDGAFDADTAKLEKRMISDLVPKVLMENCIKCNQCSFVCPHSVIRPYELSEEEYEKAPESIKERCDDKYILGVSVKDCTGCTVCVKVCPGRGQNKALIMDRLVDNFKEQEVFDYLESNISCKEENFTNVKNTQFHAPKMEFSGACAGCGQTAYIKLLTQLLGDSMIIANATGCSSIYGGSAPSSPYKVPWASSLFEDNAEYGYGMVVADKVIKDRIKRYMESNNDPLFKEWLDNPKDYDITKKVYENIDYSKHKELVDIKEFIPSRNVWAIGGDGWAYDIGFGGVDHVLAAYDNIKLLVLDTEVYSNTGGQSSKATPKGSIAQFAAAGKDTAKKDLARMMMSYPHVYVACINLAANPMQTIKTFNEANAYDGPAIIIAYTKCIAHGLQGGMENSLELGKVATTSGYFPIFRFNPMENKFSLDSKADFNLYEDFLLKQKRYSVLNSINEEAKGILKENKENAMNRYSYYESLVKGE